jgi:hypothetical protein
VQPRKAERELEFLRSLDGELRAAIRASLLGGQTELAVALDTARDFLEMVLAEEHPTPSRIAVARARVDMALAVWKRMNRAVPVAASAAD